MTCILLHKTWQMNLLGQWTPQYQSRDDLHTTTQNLADESTLANGTPSTRAEMTCIPLHKTWQMNLLWPVDPPGTRAEMTCIPLHKTWQMNLLWLMDPQHQSRDDLHTTTQNLADEPTFGQWNPQYQSRDDLHTTMQNLAD